MTSTLRLQPGKYSQHQPQKMAQRPEAVIHGHSSKYIIDPSSASPYKCGICDHVCRDAVEDKEGNPFCQVIASLFSLPFPSLPRVILTNIEMCGRQRPKWFLPTRCLHPSRSTQNTRNLPKALPSHRIFKVRTVPPSHIPFLKRGKTNK